MANYQVPGKFLDLLRSRLSLSEIVGEKVKLTRKGREFIGLCPFHHEKTPSFTVNEEKEFYHCFGCGAHGDAIRFFTETHHYSFIEAVKELASRAGLSLPQDILQGDQKQEEDLSSLRQTLQEASLWFHKNLFMAKNSEALRYTERRGLTRETLKKFGLGYAPDDYHGLGAFLKEKGLSQDLLLKGGLLVQGDERKAPYDRFRCRLMFPIHDHKGHVVAFGGRLLEKGEPKYLNSPETPLFSKGKILYGYFYAKEKMPTDPLIIVEGYMDVISLQQAGFKGAVAPLGTALTEDQILLAWRLNAEPILCFDGDSAGLKAAARAAERVLPILKPGYSLRFAFLPEGEDPDSAVKKGLLFENILKGAFPLVETLWMLLTQGKTFKTPEQKAALQKQCTVWTQNIHNNEVKKNYQYAFKDLFYKYIVGKKRIEPTFVASKKGNINFLFIHERLLLAILINHPNLLDEMSDAVSSLEFKENRFYELRNAILDFYADNAKEKDLKNYLSQKGFEAEIDQVLSPQVLIHGAFARSSASLEEARAGWSEIFNYLQNEMGKTDLKAAQEYLAEEMSNKAWQRLKMLKKSTLLQD